MSFRDDLEWWNEHCSELQDKYRGKWIAILDRKVISVGDNDADLIEEAEEKYRRMPFVVFCRPKGYLRYRHKVVRSPT